MQLSMGMGTVPDLLQDKTEKHWGFGDNGERRLFVKPSKELLKMIADAERASAALETRYVAGQNYGINYNG